MTLRTYASPEAFKQALEQRLRSSAKTGAEFARKPQLLVFDCFLGRIVAVLGDAATLKGGLVLELRLDRARTTKDVDLRMAGSPEDVRGKLQEAGRKSLGEFMAFEVGPDDDHPQIQNDGMQYDGLRFRAECKLAGKLYGQTPPGPLTPGPGADNERDRDDSKSKILRREAHRIADWFELRE